MLFVIDGLDGCGKSTQFELLKEKFTDAHFITFPYYNTNSGKIVSDYLSGKFPEENPSVSAYSASAIYAVDRYTSFKTHWQELYMSGAPVISARYTTSNAIYQMTKLPKEEWDDYLDWLYDFEYEKLGILVPIKLFFSICLWKFPRSFSLPAMTETKAKRIFTNRTWNFLRRAVKRRFMLQNATAGRLSPAIRVISREPLKR